MATGVAGITTLDRYFEEILSYFQFVSFRDTSSEGISRCVDIWKTVVSVQQHFNDIVIRIRGLAITVLTGTLAAIAYSLKDQLSFNCGTWHIPAAAGFALLGMVLLVPFWLMDAWWYHEYLIASAKHGMFIERRLSNVVPELGLSTAITEASRKSRSIFGSSTRRLHVFYLIGIGALLAICIMAFVFNVGACPGTPTSVSERSVLKSRVTDK